MGKYEHYCQLIMKAIEERGGRYDAAPGQVINGLAARTGLTSGTVWNAVVMLAGRKLVVIERVRPDGSMPGNRISAVRRT